MSTESQEVISSDLKNTEPVISELEHSYRFQKEDEIASRYRVVAPLGFGGFSEVYHCQDITLGSEVAVKVLNEKGLALEEARAAARLRRHSHIVQVYDVQTLEDETPFIVFDYVEGETLDARLNKAQYRRLSLSEESLQIMRQVSEALDDAHRNGVIHRDVKPSNIILDLQGNAYLTDFGLADLKRAAKGESMLSTAIQRRLSGTIPYMAPEQLKEGRPGDERSDLYSLGVVVYEMLTGRLPYHGRDATLIVQIATADPLPPTLAHPELPKGIEAVLLRALEKDPTKRYPSCRAFAREMEEAARAYVAASTQYEDAQRLFEIRKWRRALSAFEELEGQAPGFKDTARYLEQARHQVRLLELYEKAQQTLDQGSYQAVLDTLNVLTELDPDYHVADLRQRAHEGLAQEERRTLDEQYQQAVRQFKDAKYQACLDTLAIIREKNPDYPDTEEIEATAGGHVERQRRLRELYNRGVEQIGQEQWDKAILTFQELQQEAPGYQDVDNRLAIARHMGRMASLLQEARHFLDQEAYTACVDKLEELQRVDADYKLDQVAKLRQQALDRLHELASQLLHQERFEESLAVLKRLRERSSDYPGLEELVEQNQKGIQIRDLQAKLDDLYQQAREKLDQREFAKALRLWQEIEQRKGDLAYADPRDVKGRAREGLYNEAVAALAQGIPQQALDLWNQVHKVDPHYPDNQQVEQRARAMIERRKTIRYWAIRAGGGLGAVILLGILIAFITRGCSGGAAPPPDETTPAPETVTITATTAPTRTPLPTPQAATPTTKPPIETTTTTTPSPSPTVTRAAIATPTATRTSTPSPTATRSATPTRTPTRTATPLSIACIPEMTLVRDDNYSNFRWWGTVNSSFEKTWVLQNSGDCAWPEGVVLVHLDGEAFGASEPFEVDALAVGGEIELSVTLQVPDTTGEYEGRFELQTPEEGPIGDPLIIKLEARRFTPAPTGDGTLVLDIWDLPGTARCDGAAWYKFIFMEARGGDGVYTYFWNDEIVGGPTSESITFEVSGTESAIIGTAKVISGDGQVVTREFFVAAIDCTP